MTLQFTVFGVAIPKGSTKAFAYYAKNRATGQVILNKHGNPVLLASTSNANPKTKDWQHLVSEAASHAVQSLPPAERGLLADGVRVTLAFYFPRPKSLPRRVTAHTKAPDLDKLARNIFDAITHVVIRDDAQIVDLVAMKRYVTLGDVPHVDVRIEPTAGVNALAHDQPLFEMAQ